MNRNKGNLPDVTSQPLYWLTALSPGMSQRITDFGGSFGEYGEVLCREREGLSYIVVEQKAVIAAAPVVPGVTFTDMMPEACDIFFSSGTLQYLEDPYAVAEAGFRSARQAVVFSRVCFTRERTFRVQQSSLFQNGCGLVPEGFDDRYLTYPLQTIAEDRIAQIATDNGFRLISRIREPDAFASDDVYTVQLIYTRPAFFRPD